MTQSEFKRVLEKGLRDGLEPLRAALDGGRPLRLRESSGEPREESDKRSRKAVKRERKEMRRVAESLGIRDKRGQRAFAEGRESHRGLW